jgi:hypothetical protein
MACSDDRRGNPPTGNGNGTTAARVASRERLVSVPYRETKLAGSGTIEGKVLIDGDAPEDGIITPSVDQAQCGSAWPDSSIVRDDAALGAVVVWLSDIALGKALPVERRTEILNRSCKLQPRLQAVIAGTTVNVRNDDRLLHTTRFVRAASDDTVATIPLTDDGQVVPNERIAAEPGLILVRCDQHPWMRGHIAVFANPYFAITQSNGAFRLDSVPPGHYYLRFWHERAVQPEGRIVEVRAGEVAGVELRVRLK